MSRPTDSDRKILPADIPKIVELYQQGYTQTDISIKYNVDHSTIYYYLCVAGLIPVSRLQKIKKKHHKKPLKKKRAKRRYFSMENGEKVVIKSYKEYAREAKEKDHRHLLNIICGKEKHYCVKLNFKSVILV